MIPFQVCFGALPVLSAETLLDPVPTGTKLPIVLIDRIDGGNVKDGERVRAFVRSDILVNGKVQISAKDLITGDIAHVQHSATGDKFALNFHTLTLSDGRVVRMSSTLVLRTGRVRVRRDGNEIWFSGKESFVKSVVDPDHIQTSASTLVSGSSGAPLLLKAGDEMTLELFEDLYCPERAAAAIDRK